MASFIRIGGLPEQDYTYIGTVACPRCPREFAIYTTAGEVVPDDAIEKARTKIAEGCGSHPGNEILGPF